MRPVVKGFFDSATFTVSYVVSDETRKRCAIIDSVRDYDPASGRTSTCSADKIISYINANDLRVDWILETHAHADHLSAAPYLQEKLGGTTAIGEHIGDVQKIFKGVFNEDDAFPVDGRQFDVLFKDEAVFDIGSIEAKVLATPGHTPACVTYVVGDAAFVGDTLFMPDYGTARCDFPGGDARTLYKSIQRILSLPPKSRLFLCHDYLTPTRTSHAWETTVKEQADSNIHIHRGISEDAFVTMRDTKDASLDLPALIIPSIQVNIRAGHFPEPESNGVSYLKVPIDRL